MHSENPKGAPSNVWYALPRELASTLRPHVGSIAQAMLAEIRRAVPEYAQPLQGQFGELFIGGIKQALLHFTDRLRDPAASQERFVKAFRHLGKVEFNENRSLDSLQAAYRAGGRIAWRKVSDIGQQLGLDVGTLCMTAEAIFAFVDEISALSIEGYAQAQERAAGTMARRRRNLLSLVLSQPPASPQSIADLAATAQWTVPQRVIAVALEPRADQNLLATPVLDDQVLMDLEGTQPCLVFPSDLWNPESAAAALQGWRAAVGPEVQPSDAALSLQWAQQCIHLVQREVLPDAPVTSCEENLTTLWLLSDEFLSGQISMQVLAPLRDLTAKQRDRLGSTLLAWLRSSGSAPEIALQLDVHPQTVRYRMQKLTDLFGDRLFDPDQRLAIEICLRVEELTARSNS